MPTKILSKSAPELLASVLDHYVAVFHRALADHAHTIDVPAPIAHPLVDQIVRSDGLFEIVQSDEELTNQLDARFLNIEQAIGDLRKQITELSSHIVVEQDDPVIGLPSPDIADRA